MNAITKTIKANKDNNKTSKTYFNVYESFEQSIKEVILHREGKTYLDTWEEYQKKKSKKE